MQIIVLIVNLNFSIGKYKKKIGDLDVHAAHSQPCIHINYWWIMNEIYFFKIISLETIKIPSHSQKIWWFTFTTTIITMYGDPVLNRQIKTKGNLGPNCWNLFLPTNIFGYTV